MGDAAGDVGAGLPVTFSVGGRQYVAVSTGVGGGSPRIVPSLIAPEIHHPANGNALYVFALPARVEAERRAAPRGSAYTAKPTRP